MEALWQGIAYCLPAILVGVVFFVLVRRMLDHDERMRRMELQLQTQKVSLPTKLQAYERMALLMERIALQNLVLRTHKPGMRSRELQSELLKTIRAEFDHNLAQQVYITSKTWEVIKTAKEETIKAVNIASTRVEDHADGMEMVTVLFDIITRLERLPTDVALEAIRSEARTWQ